MARRRDSGANTPREVDALAALVIRTLHWLDEARFDKGDSVLWVALQQQMDIAKEILDKRGLLTLKHRSTAVYDEDFTLTEHMSLMAVIQTVLAGLVASKNTAGFTLFAGYSKEERQLSTATDRLDGLYRMRIHTAVVAKEMNEVSLSYMQDICRRLRRAEMVYWQSGGVSKCIANAQLAACRFGIELAICLAEKGDECVARIIFSDTIDRFQPVVRANKVLGACVAHEMGFGKAMSGIGRLTELMRKLSTPGVDDCAYIDEVEETDLTPVAREAYALFVAQAALCGWLSRVASGEQCMRMVSGVDREREVSLKCPLQKQKVRLAIVALSDISPEHLSKESVLGAIAPILGSTGDDLSIALAQYIEGSKDINLVIAPSGSPASPGGGAGRE